MKQGILMALLALSTLNFEFSNARAQGTAFTYQGQLQENGSLANGTYNLTFAVFNASSGGTNVAAPVTNNGVAVSNGLFTVLLDFGSGVFNVATNWMEIGVETNGAKAFTTLTSRQALTPTPYAIFAESAGSLAGPLPSADLSGTYGNAVSFDNAGDSFSGNGAGLNGVNATTLGGYAPSQFWNLTGNAGTIAGLNFVGTTDNQPLQLWSSGSVALVLDGTMNSIQPNIVAGSMLNSVYGNYGATIGGGYQNFIQTNAFQSSILGGASNTIQTNAYLSTIAGGGFNTIQSNAFQSAIGGGYSNTIQNVAWESTIGGGAQNTIGIFAYESTIAGGNQNSIQYSANGSTIAGGYFNMIQSNSFQCIVAGGGQNMILNNSGQSTISGGGQNVIQSNSYNSTIAGGYFNIIQTNASDATIAGGLQNTIQMFSSYSTIAGGKNNMIQGNSAYSTIAGGNANNIQSNSAYSTIAGGVFNNIQVGDLESTISGGYQNIIQTNAAMSTIAGGYENVIQSNSSYGVISGGDANIIQSNAQCAVIPGGSFNLAAGNYSFAAGRQAQALHQGAFVWADSQVATFASTANDQFNIRAQGGVQIFDNNGATAGVQLAAGATAWTTLSDRNAKKNFQPVDAIGILNKLAALPIQQWNYQWEKDTDVPHLGPMAQDFKSAFYPGRDDKGITTLEFDGVELAAIQGLNQKLNEKDAEIEKLKAKADKVDSLEKQLNELTQMVQRLAEEK